MNKLSHMCFAALTAAVVSTTVSAETATIGIRSEPSSIDPYFHNLGPNNAMLGQIFGRLVDWTPGMDQMIPKTWRVFTVVLRTMPTVYLVPASPGPAKLSTTRCLSGFSIAWATS